jgi:hypothetical protein
MRKLTAAVMLDSKIGAHALHPATICRPRNKQLMRFALVDVWWSACLLRFWIVRRVCGPPMEHRHNIIESSVQLQTRIFGVNAHAKTPSMETFAWNVPLLYGRLLLHTRTAHLAQYFHRGSSRRFVAAVKKLEQAPCQYK